MDNSAESPDSQVSCHSGGTPNGDTSICTNSTGPTWSATFTTISLSEQQITGEKTYNADLQTAGLEWGVGRAGRYAGHFHRGLTDIIFAPDGMAVSDLDGTVQHGTLLVVPPGVWFEPIELPAFWFVKFFASESDVTTMPDKETDPALTTRRSETFHCVRDCSVEVTWWDIRARTNRVLSFSAAGGQLTVMSDRVPWVRVEV